MSEEEKILRSVRAMISPFHDQIEDLKRRLAALENHRYVLGSGLKISEEMKPGQFKFKALNDE